MKKITTSILFITFILFSTFSFANKLNIKICLGDSIEVGIKNIPNVLSGTGVIHTSWNGVLTPQLQLSKWVKPVNDSIFVLKVFKGNIFTIDSFHVKVEKFNRDSLTSDFLERLVYKGHYCVITEKQSELKYHFFKALGDTLKSLKLNNDSSIQVKIKDRNGCSLDTIGVIIPVLPLKVKLAKPILINQPSSGKIGVIGIDTILERFGVKKVKVNLVKSPLRLISTYLEIYVKGNKELIKQALMNFPELIEYCKLENDSNYSSKNKNLSAPGNHPNDFKYPYTSNPHNLAAMRMPEAWSVTKKSPYTVGVIEFDGYPNIMHEDLAGRVVISAITGIPSSVQTQHATRVVGVISANSNNGVGISGVGYDILSNVVAMHSGSYKEEFPVIINYFYNSGIRVVNMSFIIPTYDDDIQKFISDMTELGMIFVAGNENIYDEINYYPAAYENVISVTGAATENVSGSNPSTFFPGANFPSQLNDYTVDYGNIVFKPCEQSYGLSRDICAPSKKVPTTGGGDNDVITNNQYVDGHGTSYATPAVSAVVSLMLSVNPCLGHADIEFILKSTARPISDDVPGQPHYQKIGSGFIDAKAAIDLAIQYSTNTLIVDNGQIINLENINIGYSSIIVKAGGVLNILNSNIRMYPNSEILIQGGGKLYSNNSKFHLFTYPNCNTNKTWKGIVVLGLENYYNNDLTKHGYLSFIQSEIKDAINCIKVGSNSSKGGRITVSQSTFEVLTNGIYFYPYNKPSLSLIINSNFKFIFAVPFLKNNKDAHTQTGIKLEYITSLKIAGCKFEGGPQYEDFIKKTSIAYDFSKRIGIGIQTLNSSVTIEKIPSQPGQLETPCEFIKLRYGVQANSSIPTRNIRVLGCQFVGCAKGIYSNGASAHVEFNKFRIIRETIAQANGEGLKRINGISIYNSTNSYIKNNEFIYDEKGNVGQKLNPSYEESTCPSSIWGPYYLGILVNNSVNFTNSILNNDFNNALVNAQLEGNNENTKIFCNNFNRHIGAINVIGNPSKYFGDCDNYLQDPNNKFTNTFDYADLANYSDINNSNNFDYLSLVSNTKRPNLVVGNNFTITILGSCVNKPSVPIFNCSQVQQNGIYNELLSDFELKNVKKQKLKNGSSNLLLGELINVNNQNSNQIFSELLINSPYLSNEILLKFIEKASFFNDSQVLKIAVENSKLNPQILNGFLSLTIFEIGTQNYSLLISKQNSTELNLILIQNEINNLTTQIDNLLFQLSDSLINKYSFDSIVAGQSELIDSLGYYLLHFSDSGKFEKERALLYLSIENLDSFNSCIARCMNPDERNKIEGMISTLNLTKNRTNDTLWLSNANFQNLLVLQNDTLSFVSSFNSGFLNFYFDSNYYRTPWHPIIGGLGKRNTKINVLENPSLNRETSLKIFPNPTNGKFTINSIGKSLEKCEIKIFNINGIEVKFKQLNAQNSDMEKIDIEIQDSINSQFLFIWVKFEDGTIRTRKIALYGI